MKRHHPKYLTILGKRWPIVRVPRLGERGKGDDGDCDPPDQPGKRIRIRQGLTPFAELETTLHEIEHACDWERLDEGYVTRKAHDTARALWRLGYRKSEQSV